MPNSCHAINKEMIAMHELIEAAKGNDAKRVRELLENGAWAGIQDAEGETALGHAKTAEIRKMLQDEQGLERAARRPLAQGALVKARHKLSVAVKSDKQGKVAARKVGNNGGVAHNLYKRVLALLAKRVVIL